MTMQRVVRVSNKEEPSSFKLLTYGLQFIDWLFEYDKIHLLKDIQFNDQRIYIIFKEVTVTVEFDYYRYKILYGIRFRPSAKPRSLLDMLCDDYTADTFVSLTGLTDALVSGRYLQ